MSQGRHGIKVLGLSLLAGLGLMVFAASAQAGEYRIEGKTLTERGIASETVAGTVAAGKFLVPALNLTMTCTGGTFSGTVLLGGTAHVAILVSGCKVFNSICEPFETKAKMETNLAADKGFISASGLGEVILMGGKHYLLVSSGFEAPFAIIYWQKLCALTLENIVFGSTVFELPNALTSLVNQSIKVIPQTQLESLFASDGLFYGVQSAWLDEGGTTNAALTGANKSKSWGGE